MSARPAGAHSDSIESHFEACYIMAPFNAEYVLQNSPMSSVQPIRWQDNRLWLLDQRLLPAQEVELRCSDAPAVAAAIRDMAVRGAPAIGIAAAYAVVLS